MSQDYSYIGVGQVYMRDRNLSGGLVPIGNVGALAFAVQEESKELMDYSAAGGGTRNEVRRITGVEASITLHDISPANLAMALYGDTSSVAEGTVTAEVVNMVAGSLSTLANVGAHTVTVTEDTDTTPATYVEGTDYEVRPGGIWFPETTTIPGATVRVNYTHPGQDVVQALNQAAGEYELVFEGVNEARSGKPHVVNVHRIRFGAAQNLDLIGDEYAGLELTGRVLSDPSKTGGLSRYFATTIVK